MFRKDWFQKVAEGLVPGYSIMEKFGENPNVTTSTDPSDVWDKGGIYVAGMCQAPKDIPDTVAQASAVAAGVLGSMTSGKGIGSMSSLSLSEIEEKAKSIHTI